MIYKNKLVESIIYEIDAVTASPVSIKADRDTLKVDDVTGKFYIPGSSITGAFRNYYENYVCQNKENILFGDSDSGMNRLICYDAFCADDSGRQMVSSRPGIRIDRRKLTGAYSISMGRKAGGKFKRLYVNDGIRFKFVFELNNYDDCDFDQVQEQFEELLAAFAGGDILLGNSKTVGFGRFKINTIYKTAYNLEDYNSLKKYLLKESDDNDKEDITKLILNKRDRNKNVRFIIKAKTTTPLLIKDEVVKSSKYPDGINIKNGSDEYVIPGSSLKGALRSRAEKIAETFPCIDRTLIDNIFGKAANEEEEASISRFVCYDTVIRNSKTGVYNKIKIDYFTGGVQQHALLQDETVMGDLEIECIFNPYGVLQNDKEKYDKEIGLLLLAIRDLCTEDLNIGGGYAVGRGLIKASMLELLIGDERLIYNFESPDKQVEDQFNSYISKLMVG